MMNCFSRQVSSAANVVPADGGVSDVDCSTRAWRRSVEKHSSSKLSKPHHFEDQGPERRSNVREPVSTRGVLDDQA